MNMDHTRIWKFCKTGVCAGMGLVLTAGVAFSHPIAALAGPAGGNESASAGDSAGNGAVSGEAKEGGLPEEAAKSVWQEADGAWYLTGPDGIPLTGWQRKDGAWYYLEENGAMATGWRLIDGSYYYMKENGAMQNVTLYEDETVYTFRENGSLAAARKKRNTGGGGYRLGFLDEEAQALADSLNELKAEDFDGDEEEDYYEDDKKDYDKDASFVLNGSLQQIAEHRLAAARAKGYGSGRIPDEGTLSDYLKSIRGQNGRRALEVYLINCDGATAAEEKLLRKHGSGEKKRSDRAVYYKEMGVAHEKVNGKDYFMVIFMR